MHTLEELLEITNGLLQHLSTDQEKKPVAEDLLGQASETLNLAIKEMTVKYQVRIEVDLENHKFMCKDKISEEMKKQMSEELRDVIYEVYSKLVQDLNFLRMEAASDKSH